MKIKNFAKKLSALAMALILVTASAKFCTFAAITATETNEVRWIDRLANIPDYINDFYSWLEENSKADGALVTAEDSLYEGINVHNTVVFTDTLPLDCTIKDGQKAINENISQVTEQVITENFNDAFEWIATAYGAFIYDHPEVFWLSGSTQARTATEYKFSSVSGTEKLSVTYKQTVMFYLKSNDFDIRSDIYRTPEVIQNTIASNEAQINKILSECDQKSDYEKTVYFNEYLTKNNYYNTVNPYNTLAHTAVSALQSMTGENAPVCEGYAKAFKILCDRSGIPCVLITGYADGAHMWNSVELDGKWYAVDVTWNDPRSKNQYISGYENEDYLLVGNNTLINNRIFSQSRTVVNIAMQDGFSFINGPVISDVTYRSTLPHICTLNNTRCSFCNAVIFDVNRDSKIDIFDLIALRKALLNVPDNGNYDCNNDGITNGIDYVALKKYILQLL